LVSLRRWTLALLLVGVVCRLARYALGFPFWGDEAYVALNLLDRDYIGLTRQLDQLQVAPVPFLWGERLALQLLGSSEWALRLLPLMASLAGLVLFWRLARLTVSAGACAIAVALLATSRWPVSLSCQVKPYSTDLLCAAALLLPAACWLRRPDRLCWPALLAALVPVALASSFPAVFVAGGVGLALLPTAWRHPRPLARWLFLAYNLLMVAAFVGFDLVLARAQLGTPGTRLHDYMVDYWSNGFPPAAPAGLARWLFQVHTGLLMAYPLGNAGGAGALAFPLVVVGAVACARARRWSLLALCLVPFALNLIAAALHRYPYGGCCRLSQHLAPAVCLLFGAGADAVGRWAGRLLPGRVPAAQAVCGALALLAVAGILLGVGKPYRDEDDAWNRKLARELLAAAGPADQVVVLNAPDDTRPVLLWYLRAEGRGRVAWDGRADWERLRRDGGRLWCVWQWLDKGTAARDPLPAYAARAPVPLVALGRVPYAVRLGDRGGPVLHATVACFARAGSAEAAGPMPVLAASP
jgi:hypothetical protein